MNGNIILILDDEEVGMNFDIQSHPDSTRGLMPDERVRRGRRCMWWSSESDLSSPAPTGAEEGVRLARFLLLQLHSLGSHPPPAGR